MEEKEIMLKVENVSKVYKLGEIGGTTLRDELQRLKAKILKKEDPTKKIGAKDYIKGEKFKALDNISFEVKKGERIGIIGHNGAGKSTLLKLISRVTGPSEGKIYLNGRVASMLEVGTGFHGELTGRENIYMNGAILGMTKKEIDKKIEDIIEFSEVRQFIDTPVKRYSSGMYVKLAFSVAAHLDSEIMIMDEVLAVGDMKFQQKCLTKMRDVSQNENRTILYVSHNMNTIRMLCDRVIVLSKGCIVFDGNVEEGIAIYSGIVHDNKSAYDLTTFKRNHDYITGKIQLLEAQNLNNGDVLFGQNLTISVRYKNIEDLKNIQFRFVVLKRDGTPVGSSLSDVIPLIEVGEHLISFQINTSNLTIDYYCLKIVVISYENGLRKNHDYVDNALYFDIVSDGENNIFEDDWINNLWGNVILSCIDKNN